MLNCECVTHVNFDSLQLHNFGEKLPSPKMGLNWLIALVMICFNGKINKTMLREVSLNICFGIHSHLNASII